MRRTDISFSKQERKELISAWAFVSIIFTLVLRDSSYDLTNILILLLGSAITAGAGFLLHEIAHKVVAIHYGCNAAFKANKSMLGFSLLIALLFKAIFIAPGAVMIRGRITTKQNGIISAAGPVTNILLAILFLILYHIIPVNIIANIFLYGVIINGWLALFNMIPFRPFDGAKVWDWHKGAFALIIIISAAITFGYPYLL